MKARMVQPEELTPQTLRAEDYLGSWEKPECTAVMLKAAQDAIQRDDQVCFDVAALYGLPYEDVRDRGWFVEALARYIGLLGLLAEDAELEGSGD